MPSLALYLLEWAKHNQTTLTPEQVAEVPEYQRVIYADELAAAQRGPAPMTAIADALRRADLALRSIGWSLLDVAANEQSGFVRTVAECRDWSAREGVQLLLLRSTHGGEVLEMRSRVHLADGMYSAHWGLGDHLGRRKFADLAEAARELLRYACDNGSAGAMSEAEAADRAKLLAPAMAALGITAGEITRQQIDEGRE